MFLLERGQINGVTRQWRLVFQSIFEPDAIVGYVTTFFWGL